MHEKSTPTLKIGLLAILLVFGFEALIFLAMNADGVVMLAVLGTLALVAWLGTTWFNRRESH